MKHLNWLFLLFCLPLFAAPDGKVLYDDNCSVCHHSRGQGGIGLPLTPEILSQLPDDYIAKTIRHGRPGRIMPSFKALSVAQVNAIVKYVRSWSGKPEPKYKAVAVKGEAKTGKGLYDKNCVRCHGKDGSGEGPGTGVTMSRERSFMVMPAALNNTGFQKSASDAMIRDIVLKGRKTGGMPSFKSKLSDQEIEHVIAYVRTLKPPVLKKGAEEWIGRPAYIMESPYDFETTVENVKQALTGANFRIFPQRYLEQGLADEFSINTRQVSIRFCNFKELYHLLNIDPRLGTVLPCRINVMEQDGKVLVISANVAQLATIFNNQELSQVGLLMEEIILTVMEEATL
jgi:cytochrome c oxidase cbb3-type subunit 3